MWMNFLYRDAHLPTIAKYLYRRCHSPDHHFAEMQKCHYKGGFLLKGAPDSARRTLWQNDK